jgi:hypothetical protein
VEASELDRSTRCVDARTALWDLRHHGFSD